MSERQPGLPGDPAAARVPLIGLTGGIASGKTTVSDRLAARGCVVVDADVVARAIVMPGEPALAEIATAFGPDVLRPDGTLDRAVLGARVFADPQARATLNGITHPRVRERMFADVEAARHREPPAIVLAVPLLFENGLDALTDESWLVDVPEETQRQRLMARDGFTPEEADARIAAQMPAAEKRRRATRIIPNGGTLDDLHAAIDAVWHAAGLPA